MRIATATEPGLTGPRPDREAWPLSVLSPDGPGFAVFSVHALGATAPRQPGLFLFVRRGAAGPEILFAGEAQNLADRVAAHPMLLPALLAGATELHLLPGVDAPALRRMTADRIIAAHDPVLNRAAAPTLRAQAAPAPSTDADRQTG